MFFKRLGIFSFLSGAGVAPVKGSLVLDTSDVAGSGYEGDTDAPCEPFVLTNGGPGSLLGPHFTFSDAWLTLEVQNVNGVYTCIPHVDTTTLPLGDSTATITIADAGASNSPQTVQVTFTTLEAIPTIEFSPTSLNLSVVADAAGSTQNVTISNSGQGTLATPADGTIVYTGAFTDWITGVTITDNGDGTWNAAIDYTGVGSSAGTYQADIPIASSGASNTPKTLSVVLVVTAAATTSLILDRSLDDFRWNVGDPNPGAETVGVRASSGLPGVLSLDSMTYLSGSTGWASLVFGTTSFDAVADPVGAGIAAPEASVARAVVRGSLTDTTEQYDLYLRVEQAAPPPQLLLSPSGIARNAQQGTDISVSTQAVSNGGSGGLAALGNIAVVPTTTQSWVVASYSNGVITYAFSNASLAPGTYNASFSVTADGAGVVNSPRTVNVQIIVAAVSGNYTPPEWTLPSFLSFSSSTDELSGVPFTAPDLGTFS